MLVSPDHFKKIAWIAVIVCGSLLLYFYFNPLLHQKPLLPGYPPNGQQRFGDVKVLDYGSNRIGDVDKLLFENDGEPAWLHFPPHTAKFVMQTASKNKMASVVFFTSGKKAADEKPVYELISVKSSLDSFAVKSLPPSPPETGKPVELYGKILEYKLDERGMVAGFVMDQYIIEIPKHIGQNIVPMLQKAGNIMVKGYQRNDNDGFVNISGHKLVKPFSIMIGQTNYLL